MAKLEGLEDVLATLSALGGEVKASTKKGLHRGAKKIQKNAKLLCPTDTGQLKNSIKTSAEETEDGAIAKVYTNSDHAAYVEFGTGVRGASSHIDRPEGIHYNSRYMGQKAQPYMSPAYLHAKNTNEVENEIIDSIQQDIRKLESGK